MAAGLLGALIGALGTWLIVLSDLGQARAALEAAEASVAQGEAREALLATRLAVDAAVEHLDQRNYGLMAQDLAQASLTLSRAGPAAFGTDPDRLERARAALQQIQVDPGAPPDTLRRELERIEGELQRVGAPAAPLGTE